jgi:hypothetical protein
MTTDSVCDSFKIVTRSEWKVKPSVLETMKAKPVSHVFIHHTEGSQWICDNQENCSQVMRSIQRFHQILVLLKSSCPEYQRMNFIEIFSHKTLNQPFKTQMHWSIGFYCIGVKAR